MQRRPLIQARPFAFYVWNLRLKHGTDYTRYFEYPKAVEMMSVEVGDRLSLLDVGSGRLGQFPLFLASSFPQLSICASDPRDDFREQLEYVEKLGLQSALASGRLRLESMDILAPIFPDQTFDRITCISTLEHIPGEGDTTAIRNMARLLKPGGLLVLSVPFNRYHNGEIYRAERMYAVGGGDGGQAASNGRYFFERIYDEPSLRCRLLEPSGLQIERTVYFGEPGYSFGRFIHAGYYQGRTLPKLLLKSRVVQILMPWLSPMFLKEITPEQFDAEDWSGVGVLIALRNPPSPPGDVGEGKGSS